MSYAKSTQRFAESTFNNLLKISEFHFTPPILEGADTGTDHFIDADKMVVARNDTDLEVDENTYYSRARICCGLVSDMSATANHFLPRSLRDAPMRYT